MSTQTFEPKPSPTANLVQIGSSVEDVIQQRLAEERARLEKEAGLVKDRAEGTRRVYYIDPEGLGELRRWLDEFWDDALTSFAKEVRTSDNARPKKKK